MRDLRVRWRRRRQTNSRCVEERAEKRKNLDSLSGYFHRRQIRQEFVEGLLSLQKHDWTGKTGDQTRVCLAHKFVWSKD